MDGPSPQVRFRDPQIEMAHGAGGKASRRLVDGLFVPLLGLSLAAFLVVDVLLGLVASTRSKTPAQSKTLANKEIQS